MSEHRRDIRETGAETLIDRVRRHETVRAVTGMLLAGSARVDISGLRGSSPAFVVEAIRSALDRPVIVVCPDEESARDAFADFRTISSGRTEFFPEKDVFPRRLELREDPTIRGRRHACLDGLSRGDAEIVVTSLLGYVEKNPPVDAFRRHVIELAAGAAVDLDDLRGRLFLLGYEATSIVEEPGEFAVRGSIVDVYDPSRENPVRLELSDDEIASIRLFEIESQRSVDPVETVRLRPATGVILTDEILDSLEARLARAGIGGETARRIHEEIADHRPARLIHRYASAMGRTGTLLDYFARSPFVFFWGEEGLAKAFDDLREEFSEAAKGAAAEEPLLDLSEYIHPLDHHAVREIPSVHLWGLAGRVADASREAGPAAGDSSGGGGVGATVGAESGSRDVGAAIDAESGSRGVGAASRPVDVLRFHTAEHPVVHGKLEPLVQAIRRLRGTGADVFIYSESPAQRERLADMMEEDEALVHLPVGWITSGFVWESVRTAILTDHEIFHRSLPRPSLRRPSRRTESRRPDHLQVGDFVVHIDYGIGRYLGLEKVNVDGHETECLHLRYQGTDRIYVPLDKMQLVEKYVGKEGVAPSIDRLGSTKWQRTKEKTRRALEDVARELLDVYAARELAGGVAFGADTPWQSELEASFPFEETPHQLKASEEIKKDMESPRPMDRLVCGDVGFGKTEVAIRAAFKAVTNGKQVGVLVPTTILAYQHCKTFRERMSAFPVSIEMLSRFRTPGEQKKIVEAINAGRVDIAIGTHRLLSADVKFRDIGLLIVDEEHRFGVRSKEKLKRMARKVDVLSMTATPIPRTLYMSLSGLRRISIIDTPPRNRHPIKTEVVPFDEETVAHAIRAEISRGGQVFLVHNRVASIHAMQAFLERIVPEARFRAAHGQMPEKELEEVILAFLDRKFDVLISTTIIESGLDFPNVNTIIINRADRFGLAELYQLRGRVGRREQQAYAYLLVPRNFTITETAGKRLQAMEEFEELGSGYRLAMRDLEIRGAGNVLGIEQHGQIVAVGFDLYCKMLKEAVERLKGEPEIEAPQCRIETRLPSFLPDDYVEDQNERMTIYKRFARFETPEEVDDAEIELKDRFGELPPPAVNLLELSRVKLRAMHLGIGLVQLRPGRVAAEFLPGKSFHPRLCAHLVETFQGRVLFKAGEPFGITVATGPGADLLAEAKKLLQEAYFYDKKYASPQSGDPT
jgi:transcription-repair coupling factor (superfamily II helicase)